MCQTENVTHKIVDIYELWQTEITTHKKCVTHNSFSITFLLVYMFHLLIKYLQHHVMIKKDCVGKQITSLLFTASFFWTFSSCYNAFFSATVILKSPTFIVRNCKLNGKYTMYQLNFIIIPCFISIPNNKIWPCKGIDPEKHEKLTQS